MITWFKRQFFSEPFIVSEVFTEELTKRIHRMALRYSDILPYFVCNAYFVQRLDTIDHYLESQSMHFNRINCLLAACIFNKLHGHVAMYASVTVADSVQTRRDEIDQILAQVCINLNLQIINFFRGMERNKIFITPNLT